MAHLNAMADCPVERHGDVLKQLGSTQLSNLNSEWPLADQSSGALKSLASSLYTKFTQQGTLADLQEAIELLRIALTSSPSDHRDRPVLLNNVANYLQCRFQQQGALADLDEAIELHQSALTLWTSSDSDKSNRSMSLNNLANCLQNRFRQRGVLADLDQAIGLHRSSLLLCQSGDDSHYMSLNNLANVLRDRFKQNGDLADLDKAIELHRSALTSYPDHSDRFMSLSNIANCLQDRFEQQGILADLDKAIEFHRSALILCPPHHSNRSLSLNNLANCLGDRFTEQGDLAALDEAIELHHSALILRPVGHSDRSMTFNNLAIYLRERSLLGALADLDGAIDHHRSALALRPPGHALRSRSLHNLAFCLQDRFEWQGDLTDLDEAIELLRSALSLHPCGHSLRAASLQALAVALQTQYLKRHVPASLHEAFGLFAMLSEISQGGSRDDIVAAKAWVISAEVFKHDSALDAYQTALRFLVQHVATLPSSPEHFDLLKYTASSLSVDAFSCGVRRGASKMAVELLEQGRALFWAQSARVRTPLDELLAASDDARGLAEEFRRLSYLIRTSSGSTDEFQIDQISHLTIQLDDVVSRIRMLPNFSRFLLPPLFSDLQKAAEEGPVIIVNASEYSCDALIVLPDVAADLVCVRLDITQTQVRKLSSDFKLQTTPSNSYAFDPRKMATVLRELWYRVVEPIVSALQTHGIRHGSRVWWCPTADFTLLPLHAAGPYRTGKPSLFNLYVSSYTPTLAALVRARRKVFVDSSDPTGKHVLGVGLTKAHRGATLSSAVAEIASVAKVLSPISSFTSLTENDATTANMTDMLGGSQWLHLACHGIPDRKQPFDSSFALHDGPLAVKNIIQCELRNPEFAFLSACHTMVGDESSPDEAIHLAAAMQFSGFKSVIGTMWSVDDSIVGDIVSTFYDNLVEYSGGRLEYANAAMALHQAQRKLWKTIPFDQRIVFVHVGA